MGVLTYGDSKTEMMKPRGHKKPGAWKRTEQRAGVKLSKGGCGAGKCSLSPEPSSVQPRICAL